MKIKYFDEKTKKVYSTWKEIVRNGAETRFGKGLYEKCKAVELNEYFVSSVQEIRKLLGIPEEGLSIDQCVNLSFNDKLYQKVEKRISALIDEYEIDMTILDCLPEIILGEYISGSWTTYKGREITLEFDDHFDEENFLFERVLLCINSPITKNKLHNYIDSNWRQISGQSQRLTINKDSFISDKDLRIVELKNGQKKYGEVADIISEEFPEKYDKINEDSVKQAYARAKEKIQNLMKPIR